MAFFNENFEKLIADSGELRKDFLDKTPLINLVVNANTFGSRQAVGKKLGELGLSELTLGDINNNKEAKAKFANAIIDDGSENANKILSSFKKVFNEAGYVAQGNNNPVRLLVDSVVGEAKRVSTFPQSREATRKIPIPYKNTAPYEKIAKVASGLINSKDVKQKEAGYLTLMILMGGYRPSDLKNLKLEKIDFQTGFVSELLIKDAIRDATKGNQPAVYKAGIFTPDILDVVKQFVGDRTDGLVFKNLASTQKIANQALKNADIPVGYTVKGVEKGGEFSLEDLRKMSETHLSAMGIPEGSPERDFLTLRANPTTTRAYVATGGMGSLELAHVKRISIHALLNGQNSVAQYLANIGIKNLSNRTKKYNVPEETYRATPWFIQEQLDNKHPNLQYSKEFISTKINVVSDELAQKSQDVSLKELELQQANLDIELGKKSEEAAEGRLKAQNATKIAKHNAKMELGAKMLGSLGIPTGDGNVDEFRALDDSPMETIFGEPSPDGTATMADSSGDMFGDMQTTLARGASKLGTAGRAGAGLAAAFQGEGDAEAIGETAFDVAKDEGIIQGIKKAGQAAFKLDPRGRAISAVAEAVPMAFGISKTATDEQMKNEMEKMSQQPERGSDDADEFMYSEDDKTTVRDFPKDNFLNFNQ